MKDLISKFLFEKGLFLIASKIWFFIALVLGLISFVNVLNSNYAPAVASGIFALLSLFFSNYTKLIHSRIELNKFKKKVIDLEKDQDGKYRVQ